MRPVKNDEDPVSAGDLDARSLLYCLAGPSGRRGAAVPQPAGPGLFAGSINFSCPSFRKAGADLRVDFPREPLETPFAGRRHSVEKARIRQKEAYEFHGRESSKVSRRVLPRGDDALAGDRPVLGFLALYAAVCSMDHAGVCRDHQWPVHHRPAV